MGVLARLRRPEYTGENRRLPCTVLNAAAVVAAALLVRIVSPRGAVLLAASPFEFDHGPDVEGTGSLASGDDPDAGTILAVLENAGVVTGGTQLALADEFRDRWEERACDVRSLGTERLAERAADATPFLAERAADAAPFPAEGSTVGEVVVVDGDDRTYLNRAVAIAEIAAVETLLEWGVGEQYRAAGADAPRLFLEECPDCGGPVVETTSGTGVAASDEPTRGTCSPAGSVAPSCTNSRRPARLTPPDRRATLVGRDAGTTVAE